jgi:hypothetical protein
VSQDNLGKLSITLETWPKVVELYSHYNLTFEKHKLTALSKLAQLIHLETGVKYAAGLWIRDLEYYLC